MQSVPKGKSATDYVRRLKREREKQCRRKIGKNPRGRLTMRPWGGRRGLGGGGSGSGGGTEGGGCERLSSYVIRYELRNDLTRGNTKIGIY